MDYRQNTKHLLKKHVCTGDDRMAPCFSLCTLDSPPLPPFACFSCSIPLPLRPMTLTFFPCSLLVLACLLPPSIAFILSGGAPLLLHEGLKKRCQQNNVATHVGDGGAGSGESLQRRCRRGVSVLDMAADDQPETGTKAKPTSEDPSLVVKAAWYSSELFGNILGMGKKKQDAITNTVTAPDESSKSRAISREEAVARLKTDFDRFYFVTGQMDLDLYEEDCTFSDPFVAFQGRQRFKNNLDNLGSLMQDVSLDVTGWDDSESSLKTKWRFRCVLGLPWRPTLAASGGTEFFFSDSGRIERHVESWDIEPINALKQLIKPGRKPRKT